jgi:hypothetical protein
MRDERQIRLPLLFASPAAAAPAPQKAKADPRQVDLEEWITEHPAGLGERPTSK